MMKLLLIVGIVGQIYADTSIYLDNKQLKQAQQNIMQKSKEALTQIPEAQKQLSAIKLNDLDKAKAQDTKVEEQQANEILSHKYKPLSTKLPSGEKYHLYSESIITDSKQYTDSFKNHPPLDINKTIADYNALGKNAKASIMDNRLLIFISSSMPKKTIVNLMMQASQIGAIFVLRGVMDGSYIKTYKYFYGLKGNNTVGIMINPTLFKAFDVNVVPTFALYKSQHDILKSACNLSPTYVKVSGTVPVKYALSQLQRAKDGDLVQIATNELEFIENKNFYNKRD